MRVFGTGAGALMLFMALHLPARAIPVFAARYGVSCQTCHTIVPRLSAFGERFKQAGYRWPASVNTKAALPIALKSNLAYTSQPDQSGLPKAIVDEVEFLAMGPLGAHWDYRMEQYLVDGGRIGSTRDAFVEYSSNPRGGWSGSAHSEFDVQAGQFTLPLPNDPETMRPTENHYAVFDQTVGENPFNLFDDRIGINAALALRGTQINAVVAKAHDPQSGLRNSGLDRMLVVRMGTDALSFYAYRYSGARALDPIPDAFWRTGIALTSHAQKERTSILLQTGNDSSADGLGDSARSSGGYMQEEWAFSDRLIGVVRYDAVNAPGAFARSATFSLSLRPYDRTRFTVEDVFSIRPVPSHTLTAAWLFAY